MFIYCRTVLLLLRQLFQSFCFLSRLFRWLALAFVSLAGSLFHHTHVAICWHSIMRSRTSTRFLGQIFQPFGLSSLLFGGFAAAIVAIADSFFGNVFSPPLPRLFSMVMSVIRRCIDRCFYHCRNVGIGVVRGGLQSEKRVWVKSCRERWKVCRAALDPLSNWRHI